MLYTLADAKSFVNSFVLSGGACASLNAVRDRVNEAQRRLLVKSDWEYTERTMRVITYNNTVTLPRQVESARLVDINQAPRRIFNSSYEFLDGGPGDTCRHHGYDLEDMGDGFPTFFEIPVGDGGTYNLFLVGPEAVSAGVTARILGCTPGGEEVHTSGVPGEVLNAAQWAGGSEGTLDEYPTPVSASPFGEVFSVHLSSGRTDYVSLYAVDTATRQMYFLAKYHPDETVPGYRRYRILGYCPPAAQSAGNCANVLLRVKLRHTPLSRDDDVLLIQNLDAIKNMVMAIREENSGNVQQSLIFEQKALMLLSEQESNKKDGQPPVINVDDVYGYGRAGRIN